MAHWLKDPALSLSWVGTLAQELPQAAGVAKKKKKEEEGEREKGKKEKKKDAFYSPKLKISTTVQILD